MEFHDEVLKDLGFANNLCLVAVNELHIVDQWGQKFRPEYSQLAALRKRINRDVPWFGTSATLDPDMLERVKELVGFNSDVKLMRTSIDRPEIGFEIRPMEYAATSFGDLEFLVETAKEHPPSAADLLQNRLVDAVDQTPSSQTRMMAAAEAIRIGDLESARGFLQGENMASRALVKAAEFKKRQKELEARW